MRPPSTHRRFVKLKEGQERVDGLRVLRIIPPPYWTARSALFKNLDQVICVGACDDNRFSPKEIDVASYQR